MTSTLACIGGVSAYQLLHRQGLITRYLGLRSTPYGESQPLALCESDGGCFVFLARFGDGGHALPPHAVNYRANLYALKEMNAECIVSWTESKAISHNYRVGQYVLVDDIIDETVTPPTSFMSTADMAEVRQWPVFCPSLRQHVGTAFGESDCELSSRGVVVCVEGHRQETPAEARKFASYGGDLIGRALAPEAFLAKELGLAYASICYVAQYAESGSSARPFERGEVLDIRAEQERVDLAIGRLPQLMGQLVAVLRREGVLADDAGECSGEASDDGDEKSDAAVRRAS